MLTNAAPAQLAESLPDGGEGCFVAASNLTRTVVEHRVRALQQVTRSYLSESSLLFVKQMGLCNTGGTHAGLSE